MKEIGNDLRWWNTCWRDVCPRRAVTGPGGRGEDLLSCLAWMEVTARLLGKCLSMSANSLGRRSADYGASLKVMNNYTTLAEWSTLLLRASLLSERCRFARP